MFCRMCGEQIPDNSEVCPACGEDQHMTTGKDVKKMEDQRITMPEKAGKAIGKAIGKVDGAILRGAVAMGKGVVAMVGAASEEVKKALCKEKK